MIDAIMQYVKATERVHRFVEGTFQRSGETRFPTVREVSKALRISQRDVRQHVEDDDEMMLTYYHMERRCEPHPGEYFVETLT